MTTKMNISIKGILLISIGLLAVVFTNGQVTPAKSPKLILHC
jgi:hypothetical protein